jgi:hypothetical protein
MDTPEILGTLFEHQKLVSRKAELVLEIAEAESRQRTRETRAELDSHKRNEHGFKFQQDPRYAREELAAISELRQEYGEVCEKIKLLEEMLVDLEPPTLIFHS